MQINVYELMRIFIEIVETGSFSQASENLQIHRPAVTKALQQLEQHCGVRLLHRTTRRINLTPEGEEFYRSSKPLLEQTDFFLRPYINDGRLVEVLPGNPVPARRLSVLYPHRHISPKVRVFTQWLETLLEGVQ